MTIAATCAPPLTASGKPRMTLPQNACDCHFHIFDEPSQQVPERSYTAPTASQADYDALMKTLGFTRSVIVQPSIYGDDNQTTMLACQGQSNRKAIVVIDETISRQELQALHEQGAVGCRINWLFQSGININNLQSLAGKIAEFGWHIQVLADISQIESLEDFIRDVPVPIIFDHMGHMPTHKTVHNPHFKHFCRLLSEGRIWAKLSGAYRISSRINGLYEDAQATAEALMKANPDHLVWGTDWPHPQTAPMPDDTQLLNSFLEWIPASLHQRIFSDNPARLYQFENQ